MGIIIIIIIIIIKVVGFYARKSPSLGEKRALQCTKSFCMSCIGFFFWGLLSDKENSPGNPQKEKKNKAGLEHIILLSNYTTG
jgi:hypothetical protein